MPLREIGSGGVTRLLMGMPEFDAVLGGGTVPGSLTLVGGPPGAGKSTLMLQIAARLARDGEVVYVCGEESAAQVKLRADRTLASGADPALLVYPETNLRAVLDRLERQRPLALVIDSIQTVWLPESEAYAGSITQIRDCTQALMEYSKRTGCATFIVGHVTKDGAIAGPRLLEHLVDTVLYFEGETNGEYRILRAYKNRFGSVDEICVFSMHDSGLREVSNPSELFAGARTQRPSGSCVVASIVGSRPVLIEVQALVGETSYGTPRRLANNLDQQRLAMILAVLERRAGFLLGTHDVYASVAGGLRVGRACGGSRNRSGYCFVVSQCSGAFAHRRLRRAGVIRRGSRRRRSRAARSRGPQARLQPRYLAREYRRHHRRDPNGTGLVSFDGACPERSRRAQDDNAL